MQPFLKIYVYNNRRGWKVKALYRVLIVITLFLLFLTLYAGIIGNTAQ